VSLISPCMAQLVLPTHPGFKDALSATLMSLVMALLCWHAPQMAASMIGGVAVLTGQAPLRTLPTAGGVSPPPPRPPPPRPTGPTHLTVEGRHHARNPHHRDDGPRTLVRPDDPPGSLCWCSL